MKKIPVFLRILNALIKRPNYIKKKKNLPARPSRILHSLSITFHHCFSYRRTVYINTSFYYENRDIIKNSENFTHDIVKKKKTRTGTLSVKY